MRVGYFDGLKGVSALIVMLTHFVLCFNQISWLQYVPIVGMFFDGGMAVYVFIMLSAFSLCCSLDIKDIEIAIVKTVMKRYFRLTMPIILPSILAFVFCLIGWNYNVQLGVITGNEWTRTLLPEYLKINQLTSGIAVGVLKGSALINPLWMMKYIFVGTFITIPLFCAVRAFGRLKYKMSFLLLFAILFYSVSPYYTSTIFGIVLYIIHNRQIRYGWFISLISGTLLLLVHIYDIESTKQLRAVLLVIAVEYAIPLHQLLSSTIMLKLNEISYQLYLVHATLLASICCLFYMHFNSMSILSYCAILIMFFALTIIIAFFLSEIDKMMNNWMNKLYNCLLQK